MCPHNITCMLLVNLQKCACVYSLKPYVYSSVDDDAMREPKKKKSKGTRRLSGSPKHQKSTRSSVPSNSSEAKSLQRSSESWAWDAAYTTFGVAVACYLGYFYATHAKQLHENELWFSHISVSYLCTFRCMLHVCNYTLINMPLSVCKHNIIL